MKRDYTAAPQTTDLFATPTPDEPPSAPIVEAKQLARNTDPQTSHDAAERALRFRLSHAAAITGVLWRPMIPPEIAKFTGLSIVQIDRRRKELLEAGEIRLTGVEREGYQEWTRATVTQ